MELRRWGRGEGIGRSSFCAASLLAALFIVLDAHGQATSKRLSSWLLEQPTTADAYPLGLSWRVPEEIPAQHALRLEILRKLTGADKDVGAHPDSVRRLGKWLSTLPVTGRVPVAVSDPRWLEVNPSRDPIIQQHRSVVLPRRPRTVTVITGRGERCPVIHSPGHEARSYVESCNLDGSRADWAWIAQPDGRLQRYGTAIWNRETQDEPAPGAWIWAPPRNSGWPERLSEQLISFLATQGPAPDPDDVRRPEGQSAPAPQSSSPGLSGGAAAPFSFSDLPAIGSKPAESPRADDARPRPSPGIPPGRSRSLQVTASDWGGAGLLQTPTARMAREGEFTFTLSRTSPYTRGNVFVQPFPWLEAGFRYVDIANRLYGPESLSGDQSDKDKGFDAKITLLNESAYLPQLALGVRDLAGTGLFSGEYVVGNKRFGAFDLSLGLGWGYVGARGNVRNPLTRLSSRFDTRTVEGDVGGNVSFGSYFRGPTALFGGIQYDTPWERLVLKLEYDGNNYQREPQENNQRQSSPFNFGLVYRLGRAVDLTLGVERGNTVMAGITLHTDLDGLSMPKLMDPPRVSVADSRPQRLPDWSATSTEIGRQANWHVRGIEQRGRELRLSVDDAATTYWRERLDRAAAVLHRDAPADIDRFTIDYRQNGTEVAEHVVDRDAWVGARTRPLPPREARAEVIERDTTPNGSGTVLYENRLPRLETGLGLAYQQTLGGPDGFILYQIGVYERARWRLRDDTWVQGTVQLRLHDNYEKFRFTGPSDLPRVRTFLREYLTTSEITIPNLQAAHVGRLSQNQYYSLYGGYLETMFAGVGGEWMYRPFGSAFAFGVDVNAVRQRDFRQNFALRDYRAKTGHGTLYWDTGWNNVQVNLSAGQYLAGDRGGTLQLSRVFQNGVTVGAYATKTNVSAQQFGEGSFDKGVFVNIPFDAFLPRSSNSSANILWKPLTRDGGAKLSRSVNLYDITSGRDDRALRFKPAPRPNEELPPADRRESWTPRAAGPEPYTQVTPRPPADAWQADTRYEQRLLEALYSQDFRNIRIAYDGSHRLSVSASHDGIRPVSRAVGRAARTALRLAPLEAREIRVEFLEHGQPVVTYEFIDLARLERYFNGALDASELAKYVAVQYVQPSSREKDPFALLGDTAAIEPPRLLESLPGTGRARRVADDFVAAGRTAMTIDWLQAAVAGTGLVVSSAALDERAYRFSRDRAEAKWMKAGIRVGNAIPWLALGGAAIAALDASDPVASRTGHASLEAGATAFMVATGLKYAVGRERPGEGVSTRSFNTFSADDRNGAFPSRHTMVAWAAVTPFAREYNAPWLYGVAALTNLGRVGSREHWVSDTVASSVIGYGIGRIFHESSRPQNRGAPRVLLSPSGVALAWKWD